MQKGFTLIEILVSMMILAIISSLTYSGLSSVVKARDILTTNQERIDKIQQTIVIMERDLLQISPRIIRSNSQNNTPAMVGSSNKIEFTRSGRPNTLHNKQSIFIRIAYELDGKKLIRKSWNSLDRSNFNNAKKLVLLDNVERLNFKFYDKKWHSDWPQSPNNKPNNQSISYLSKLPSYLIFEITLDGFGKIIRLLPGVN